MNFSEQLNEYMILLNCLNKDIAEVSGLSTVVISRYKNGLRTPSYDSKNLTALAKGLSVLAERNNIKLSEESILFRLHESLEPDTAVDSDKFTKKMKNIMSELKITNKELSTGAGYDPSYLSRIMRGTRVPYNLTKVVNMISTFLASNSVGREKKIKLCSLIGADETLIDNAEQFREHIFRYLSSFKIKEVPKPTVKAAPINSFLQKLDDFNLEDYISAIHFDDVKIPTIPFHTPSSHFFYGLDGMKEAELHFMRETALSNTKDSVISYCDMPISKMAHDPDFSRRFMLGHAMMIKKGLHINMIHDVSRPIREMMIGLEAFIPLYMTGQISPYYLKHSDNRVFNHLIRVSGSVVLCGESIVNHHDEGRYYLSTKEDEVQFYRKQAEFLLEKTTSLMDIFNSERSEEFSKYNNETFKVRSNRKKICSILPTFTLSTELLERMLKNNTVSKENSEKIKNFIERTRKMTTEFLERNTFTIVIPELSEELFQEKSPTLYMPELFLDFGLKYTYEDYSEHLEQTKAFVQNHEGCTLEMNNLPEFKNIDITIIKGKQVIVSKAKSPTIHFVINHPKMVKTFENFTVPIII